VPCDENDWESPVRHGELPLKIKTALPRKSHVEDQANGTVRRILLEKIGDGGEKLSFQANRSQQTARRSGSSSMTKTVGFPSGIVLLR
jgi:hypothetical protein